MMDMTGYSRKKAGPKPASTALCCVFIAALIGLTAPVIAQQQTAAKPPVTIDATEFLEWNQTDGTYIAKGNAHVEQGDTSIKANHIVASYQPDSASRDLQRIIATGAVIYVNGANQARGSKLDYDVSDRTYELSGPDARASSPDGEMTATRSITYDEKNIDRQEVIAIGGARYYHNDGRTIHGDRLVAYLDAAGSLISIDAFGNTKVITTQGTTATADKLNYLASTAMANLYGNVEIIDKDNVMRGARAEVDFDKDVSRILSDGKQKRVSGVLTP
jgi:lipopolysaccharide export system protein LptA